MRAASPRRAARAATFGLAVLLALGLRPGDDPPAGFQRYFERGRIPALDTPTYVPAAQARLPADAWVLGVVVDGTPLAYELNLLTRTEVVNDRVGGRSIAVVWCPLANSAVVYDRRIGGRELHFEPSGVLMHGSIVMQDRETESYWPLLHERALYGPLLGSGLARIPGAVKSRYGDWLRDHPDTLVWSLYGQERLDPNPMFAYLASETGYGGTTAQDARLPTKEPVFGFTREGRHYAIAGRDAEGGWAFRVAGEWVFLYRPLKAALNDTTRAFVSRAGFERVRDAWREKASGGTFDERRGTFGASAAATPLEGFDTFWYVWSLNFPDTELLGRQPDVSPSAAVARPAAPRRVPAGP